MPQLKQNSLHAHQKNNNMNRRDEIRSELESARSTFHELLNSLSDKDLQKKSHNPGWTNREILFHMLLGFIVIDMLLPMVKMFGRLPPVYSKIFANILNFSTPVFNVVNAFGARMGGRIFSKHFLEKKFDGVIQNLLKKLEVVKNDEWEQGMYYPNKWDGLFGEYMTIKKLFHYPTTHFKFHREQLSGI